MKMEVNLIQAGKGDCILVRCGVGIKKANILIDSGISKDFFRKALNRIIDNEEKIDILIFTHDDNDHIKGASDLLKQLERKKSGKSPINLDASWTYSKICVPQYKKLFGYLTDDRILFNFGGNGTETLLGVRESKELFERFKELDIQKLGFVLADADEVSDVPFPNMLQLRWKDVGSELQSEIIKHPSQKDLATEMEHLEIVILSPAKKELVDYIQGAWEMQKKKDVLLKAEKKTCQNEWEKSIQYWLLNETENKNKLSPANRASIAFLLIYGDRCGLFAGDASPAEMVSAGRQYLARKQSEQDYMEVDFIKLPHHGSSHNVNREFLKFFRTKTYFVTTEGNAQYRHPGKVTLALIASVLQANETAHIYSSYTWWKENQAFCRSERSTGNWRDEGELCILEDVDGTAKYLRFHKVGATPLAIGKDIFVRR